MSCIILQFEDRLSLHTKTFKLLDLVRIEISSKVAVSLGIGQRLLNLKKLLGINIQPICLNSVGFTIKKVIQAKECLNY